MLDDIDGKHSDILRRIGIDEEIELAGAPPVQHVVAEMPAHFDDLGSPSARRMPSSTPVSR
jgi:hypothetical protein